MRDGGGVQALLALLDSGGHEERRLGLFVLGNVSSDTFDPEGAWRTREILGRGGGIGRLLRHLHSDDRGTLLCAVCAVQNVCVGIECVDALRDLGQSGSQGSVGALQSFIFGEPPEAREARRRR